MRRCPAGLQPSLSPLFSPSGLIYRYVLQSPDRSPQDLKTIEDWVLERHYRSIQGVADDSGFGGTTMQYQVLLDPNKLFAYGVSVPQVVQQLGNNNANAGRRILFAGRAVLLHPRAGPGARYRRTSATSCCRRRTAFRST